MEPTNRSDRTWRMWRKWRGACVTLAVASVAGAGCAAGTGGDAASDPASGATDDAPLAVADTPTRAQAADGSYISWREHIIDDLAVGGVAIGGSDGLEMADLDLDGHEDIVSVHESDVTYDGVPDGHVRIAYGSADPDTWDLYTPGRGRGGGRRRGRGHRRHERRWVSGRRQYACELAHVIYFENPGAATEPSAGSGSFRPRPSTGGRTSGSSWRTSTTCGPPRSGRAVLQGGQNPPRDTTVKHPVSWFAVPADPLVGDAWVEHESDAGHRADQLAAVRPRRRGRPRRHRRLAHGADASSGSRTSARTRSRSWNIASRSLGRRWSSPASTWTSSI